MISFYDNPGFGLWPSALYRRNATAWASAVKNSGLKIVNKEDGHDAGLFYVFYDGMMQDALSLTSDGKYSSVSAASIPMFEDKIRQKQSASAAGITTPMYVIPGPDDDYDSLVASLGEGFMMKSNGGTGQVRVVRNKDEYHPLDGFFAEQRVGRIQECLHVAVVDGRPIAAYVDLDKTVMPGGLVRVVPSIPKSESNSIKNTWQFEGVRRHEIDDELSDICSTLGDLWDIKIAKLDFAIATNGDYHFLEANFVSSMNIFTLVNGVDPYTAHAVSLAVELGATS